jgi:hypothetical protein
MNVAIWMRYPHSACVQIKTTAPRTATGIFFKNVDTRVDWYDNPWPWPWPWPCGTQANAVGLAHALQTGFTWSHTDTPPNLRSRLRRSDIDGHAETDGRKIWLIRRNCSALCSHVSPRPFAIDTNGSRPPSQSIRCKILSLKDW